MTEPGTRVSINLSNLDADLDAVLYAPPAGTIVPTSDRAIVPTEDEGDNGLPAAGQVGTQEVQPTQGDDIAAPPDLNALATVQASFNRGKANEQIDTGQLTRLGTYYLAVTGYDDAALDSWAKQAQDWAKGDRDVFLFFIAGAKVRNPAAAQALIAKLG